MATHTCVRKCLQGNRTGYRMSHRKWRESKQQLTSWLDLTLPGCCLVSLHILRDILLTFTEVAHNKACLGLLLLLLSFPSALAHPFVPSFQFRCPTRRTTDETSKLHRAGHAPLSISLSPSRVVNTRNRQRLTHSATLGLSLVQAAVVGAS